MKLYKYLRKDYADLMVNKGIIQIGTLSYYRNLEDIARADLNEGKLEKSTTFRDAKTINNKVEFDDQLRFLHGSNINYTSGKIQILPGTTFSVSENILDSYIFCTSIKFSENLMEKFGAEVCVEIFNIQLFLDIISDELVKQNKIYPKLASGRKIEYLGHEHSHEMDLSGNWLKDKIYKEEDEFRFDFIPIYKKNGKKIQPIVDENNNATFPTDIDPLNIEPFIITRNELTKCCRLL